MQTVMCVIYKYCQLLGLRIFSVGNGRMNEQTALVDMLARET